MVGPEAISNKICPNVVLASTKNTAVERISVDPYVVSQMSTRDRYTSITAWKSKLS